MRKAKLFTVFMIILLVLTQFSFVSAASSCDVADSICGTVQKITVKTDTNTGVSTVWVVIQDDQGVDHTVQISMATALEWHLVVYEDGKLVPNDDALGSEIELPLSEVIPPDEDEDMKHPVGSALAVFFSEDISGLTYDKIMDAHQDGYGFGVIAQALWLTKKLNGDSQFLLDVLEAKSSGDFQAFFEEGDIVPTSWGQFRKVVMDKGTLGMVMSDKDKEKDKDKGDGKPKTGDPQGNVKDNGNNADKGTNDDAVNKGNEGNKENNGNHGNNENKDNNGNKDKPQ